MTGRALSRGVLRAVLTGTLVWLVALVSGAASARAAQCWNDLFEGARFTTCGIDLNKEELRLFLRGPSGQVLGSFQRVDLMLAPSAHLGVAMNAGMFHDDRRPVGLYIEDGQQEMRVVTNPGPGNFGMLPNGVLCLTPTGRARLIESRLYAQTQPACRYATQSGPMLVLDGALHPRFVEGSTSVNIRNGVGVSEDGRSLWMVISDDPVNFHTFARYFRDQLGLGQALYLDGRVSRIYAPQIGRRDLGFPVGPILGTVERSAPQQLD